MAFAPFFERARTAAGRYLPADAQSLEDLLHACIPTVACGDAQLQHHNSRWIAELSVNLLARLYPRLSLLGAETDVQHLSSIARQINPFIEVVPDAGLAAFTIAVEGALPGAIHARADGWVASTLAAPSLEHRGPVNAFASGGAACLSVAEIFRRVVLRDAAPPWRDVRVSLLDYGSDAGRNTELPPHELESIALVGLGAVGNSAVWALGRYPKLSGTCWVVDDESVELSNLQRYVLTTASDVGEKKVRIAARVLELAGAICKVQPMTLAQFAASFNGRFPVETLCISVDNVDARRAAQALLPRTVVNGFTGDRSLGASWHELSRAGACLACLYQPAGAAPSQADLVAQTFGIDPVRAAILLATNLPLTTEELSKAESLLGAKHGELVAWAGRPVSSLYVELVCGGAVLPVPSRGRSEVVPLAHQSALAGILMAAELIKRSNNKLRCLAQRQPLVAWHDVLRASPRSWVEPRQPVTDCICSDENYLEAYSTKWPAREASISS